MSENKKHPNAEYIIAFAEGKQLQFLPAPGRWVDFQGEEDETPHIGPWNAAPELKWRIKPEQQWVRVAVLKQGDAEWLHACLDTDAEQTIENLCAFSHWQSDRLYYTPKECP